MAQVESFPYDANAGRYYLTLKGIRIALKRQYAASRECVHVRDFNLPARGGTCPELSFFGLQVPLINSRDHNLSLPLTGDARYPVLIVNFKHTFFAVIVDPPPSEDRINEYAELPPSHIIERVPFLRDLFDEEERIADSIENALTLLERHATRDKAVPGTDEEYVGQKPVHSQHAASLPDLSRFYIGELLEEAFNHDITVTRDMNRSGLIAALNEYYRKNPGDIPTLPAGQ
ncbi:MAG: hypothetical protein ACQEQV_02100 [Fibrobacterota bacterium]